MVTIQNVDVRLEVEGDGDEAVFARLFDGHRHSAFAALEVDDAFCGRAPTVVTRNGDLQGDARGLGLLRDVAAARDLLDRDTRGVVAPAAARTERELVLCLCEMIARSRTVPALAAQVVRGRLPVCEPGITDAATPMSSLDVRKSIYCHGFNSPGRCAAPTAPAFVLRPGSHHDTYGLPAELTVAARFCSRNALSTSTL